MQEGPSTTDDSLVATLSPVAQALVRLCRASHHPRAADGAVEALSTEDVGALLELIDAQRLAPYIGRWLATVPVGEGKLERVRHHAAGRLNQHAKSALARSAHLRPILQALHDHGVTVIPLKGFYLAEAVYQDIAVRPMVDVDLLVSRTQARDAARVFEAHGFTFLKPFDWETQLAGLKHLPPLLSGATSVEIHVALSSPDEHGQIDAEAVTARATPAVIARSPVRALTSEDLLLHVAHHGLGQHRAAWGITCLLDLAALIELNGPGIDWSVVIARARAWSIASEVAIALELMNRLLGTAIPSELSTALAPDGVPRHVLEAAALQLLDSPHRAQRINRGRAQLLSSGKTIRDRSRHLLRLIFPERVALASYYGLNAHSGRLWFAYPLRLFTLALRLPALWRLARDPDAMAVAQRTNTVDEWFRQGGPQ